MFKIKTLNNFIAGLLIIAVLAPSALFFTQPKKAEAQFSDPLNAVWQGVQAVFNAGSWVIDKTLGKIEFQKLAKDILKEIGMVAARKVLQKMTQNTVNWINSGFHGNPFFIENSSSFFKDIAKSEIKNFIDMTGYNSLRYPFGKSFALETIDSYKRQLDTNLEYSLSRVLQDPILLNNYRNDFNVGGWNGFLINTQYPQNNYIGYRMLATEELARRLAGTTQNAAEKVQETLAQGQGFLSPKTCPSNESYNNIKNEFQRPAFKSTTPYNPPKRQNFTSDDAWANELLAYEEKHAKLVAQERQTWESKNTCPGGLVTTTPGSVIANAAMEALNAPKDNVVAAMVTGSLATIFDALLNKFMDDGLNALAKKINPPPEDEDDWDYFGNTLGTVSPYGSDDWGSGPDIEIVLDDFKQMVREGLENTQTELDLLDNSAVNESGQFINPGLVQMLGVIWPKIKNLDICLPGPDLGWEERLNKELERNSQVFMGKLGETDGRTAAESQKSLNELTFAVKFFEDWIKNKMMVELPNSIIYLETVHEIEDLHQLAEEIITRKRTKTQTKARLQAIDAILGTINNQPEPDTADEKKLIEAWKQYSATRSTVSNPTTIGNTRNELLVLQEQYDRVDGLLTQCEGERRAGGWTIPNYTTGGATSINTTATGNDCKLQKNLGIRSDARCTEQQMFCSYPIHGGYAHDPFNTNRAFWDYNGPDVTHPEIPLVNASRVIYGNDCGFLGARCAFSTGELTADIKISCDIVFNSTPLDYKGGIPGANNETYVRPPKTELTVGGQCGDTCAEHGHTNLYEPEVKAAARRALAELEIQYPGMGELPSYDVESGGTEEGIQAVVRLRDRTISILQSQGFNAEKVSSPDAYEGGYFYPQLVGIWKNGDPDKHGYRITAGGGPIREAIEAGICGAHRNFDDSDVPPAPGSAVAMCLAQETNPGGECNETGKKYSDALRSAMDAVIAANPAVANLPNIEDSSSGRGMKANAKQFLDLVAIYINSQGGGWNATADVLNGNNNTSTGDIIGIWKTGDTVMERYDAIAGSSGTVGAATQTIFEGFIPLNCTATGGGTNCSCSSENDNPPPVNPPVPPPTDGTPYISSISPSTATAGTTVLTINGSNFSTLNKPANVATVRFYFGLNGRTSVDGTVNAAKTQITIKVPAEINTQNTTIKVYRDGSTESNPYQIQLKSASATVPATSYNASGGWGGNIAYNSTNNTWLVVSSGTPKNGTYGRIMNSSGAVSPEIVITAGHSGGPKVAYAPDINKYLVVWLAWDDSNQTSVSQIKGRFINSDGSFSGNEFIVHNDTTYPNDSSIAYSNSPMQYDSKNKKFVYVWQTMNPGRHSNMRMISSTGVVGPRINLTSGLSAPNPEDGRGDPAVAIKESTNEYCVVYQRGYSSPAGWNASIRARTVNALTGAMGAETVVHSETGPNAVVEKMSIVYNATNNKYLVGWSGTGGAKGKFMTSCNGSSAGTTITLNSQSSGHSLAYNPKSNRYASIGQNQDDSGNTYVILNSNGGKISEGIAFFGGYGNFSPVIYPNTTDGTFAATSAYEYGVTRFAPNLGTPTASSITQPVSVPKYIDLGAGSFPDVVWFQTRLYVAYRTPNNLAINLYSFDKNLSDQKLEKIFVLSTGAGGFPRMTVHNNTLWLAYRDGEASNQDIKLWNKETGLTESLGPAVGNDPVAVGNGYIAWQKCEGTNCADSKVYRRQLTGGTEVFIRSWLPTGISRILPNGSVVMIDTDRNAVTWGVNAWFAGKLTVATDITPQDDNGVAARINNLASSEFNLWTGQRTHTPHAATDNSGNYAVATWNPTIRVATFTGPI